MSDEHPLDHHCRKLAKEQYSHLGHHIDFDEVPEVSPGADGAYVQAWVYVSYSDLPPDWDPNP